jgi:chemotaxis protein MotB
MARKRKHPEHVNHERWLVSYADFITLLFAFFVVMFAASNSDQKKAGQVAQAVQVAFKEMAVFSPSGKVVPLYDNGGLPTDTKSVIGNAHSAFDATQLVASAKPGDGNKATIAEVKAQLETMLKEEVAKNTVRISEDSRGLTVSLAEAGFFDPGSAVMQLKALAVVDRIASTLKPLGYNLRVEGHTDNIPIHTAQFPSNWELSTGRATFLLQYLISNTGIPPVRLSAVGYGEYRPVSPNTTAEGRASNRRVDLVVLGAAAEKLEPQLR